MIIDTSIIIALLKKEQDAPSFSKILLETKQPILLSASSYVECCAVILRMNQPRLVEIFHNLLKEYKINVEPFTYAQALIAEQAYAHYGLGTGYPSVLNLGDCFSYALAKDKNVALLFKGDDFSKTDVKKVF